MESAGRARPLAARRHLTVQRLRPGSPLAFAAISTNQETNVTKREEIITQHRSTSSHRAARSSRSRFNFARLVQLQLASRFTNEWP